MTKPNHPWTNGQVERMNRTLKEATVRRYHYDSHDQLRQHLGAFLDAYNFGKRLKTLKGLTPFESVCAAWTKEPARFRLDPIWSPRDYTAGRSKRECGPQQSGHRADTVLKLRRCLPYVSTRYAVSATKAGMLLR